VPTQNKFIKIGLLVGFLIVLMAVAIFLYRNNNKIISNQNGQESKLNSEIVEEKVIASNGEGFPRFIPQQGVELIIAPYQYTWDIINEKLLESYGVLVFRYNDDGEIKKIDTIEYSYGTACFVSFSEENGASDFNKDGIKELIIDIGCRNGSGPWVYTWVNNSLKPINPIIPTDDPSGVTFDSDTQFIDIDNDGIMEASLIYEKFIRLGPGPDDVRIDVYNRTYKWDGTEKPYYLWKEEKISG